MRAETADHSDAIVAKALASVGEVATLPEVTVKIIELVENPDSSPRDLHQVIKLDPALSTKLLRVANSAFYGLPGQVANVDRAILILGLAAVKNIAVATSLVHSFKGKSHPDLFDPRELWRHSIAVAVAAAKIGKGTSTLVPPDEFFLAGLIHDLGLIVERQAFPEKLAEVCRRCSDEEIDFLELEEEVIGATHQEFGHALATKWRFPHRLKAGVSFHHTPESAPDGLGAVAGILRCADLLCCEEKLGFELPGRGHELTPKVLDGAGVTAARLAEIREGLMGEIEEAEGVFGSAG